MKPKPRAKRFPNYFGTLPTHVLDVYRVVSCSTRRILVSRTR